MKNITYILVVLFAGISAGCVQHINLGDVFKKKVEGPTPLTTTTLDLMKVRYKTKKVIRTKTSDAVEFNIPVLDKETWGTALAYQVPVIFKKDTSCLISFQARCLYSEDESAEGSFTLYVRSDKKVGDGDKTIKVNIPKEWRTFNIPFQIKANTELMDIWFLLGGIKPQKIELKNFTISGYGPDVPLSKLPMTKITCPGLEPDAPWRKEAAARIAKYRKADFTIEVVDADGKPVSGAALDIKQDKNEFQFGVTVSSRSIAGEKISELNRDKMHSVVSENFNNITIGNGLKWKLNQWFKIAVPKTVDWARKNNLPIRGHCLLWGKFNRAPKEVEKLRDHPEQLRTAIRNHIKEFSKKYPDIIYEWDVLNEPYPEQEFMEILGKEEAAEWFKIAKKERPDCRLFVNDYAILAGDDIAHREGYYDWVKLLLKNKAPIDGIGFQGHFRSPVSPEKIYKRIEKFVNFGKKMRITEFDFFCTDPELQYNFTEAFYTMIFSHPDMYGITNWTLWAKNSPYADAALFDEKWNPTGAGKAVIDFIKKHRTDTTGTTDSAGKFFFNGYKGSYKIKVIVNGKEKTVDAKLAESQTIIIKI